MNPILGIVASSISGSLNASSYESIQTVTVGSTQTSISFSSIPSTYKHLQIRWIARVSPATTDENLQIQVGNGSIDTGTNYSHHGLYGTGSAAAVFGNASVSGANLGRVTGASSSANMFGAGVIDILDYANTNKYKTFRGLSGDDQNGSGLVWFASGSWQNTAAITNIQLNELYGSGGFVANSLFALYGVK